MKKALAPTSARPAGKPGRDSKRTPQTAAKILAAIEDGLPLIFAAAKAGIGKSCLYSWRADDEEFGAAVDAAVAQGIETRLKLVQHAAQTDWRAAAWLLERTAPEFFARSRIEVNHSGVVGHIVISPEQLQAITESRKEYERTIDAGP